MTSEWEGAMSAKAGQWDDDDDLLNDEGDQSQAMKNLRDAYKALKRENQTLKTQVEESSKATRKSTLTQLLKARELPDKIAAFIPSEVEATEEAVGKWLEEYGDVFGVQPPAQQQQSALSDEQIAAMRQMDVIAGSTSSAQANDMLQRIQSAESPEALIAMIQAAGGGS